jgi:hypothetical protein
MAADTFCISPFFSTLSFSIQYPSSQQITTAHDIADTFTNTRTIGVSRIPHRKISVQLRRLRRRLDDLHMGTARTGYSSMALWIFDFRLALAGLQHHKRVVWRVNSSALLCSARWKGSVWSFSLSQGVQNLGLGIF